jgi:hypothetical protein
VIKIGEFLIKTDRLQFREAFQKRLPRKFCSKTFYNSYKNLVQMPNTKKGMIEYQHLRLNQGILTEGKGSIWLTSQ